MLEIPHWDKKSSLGLPSWLNIGKERESRSTRYLFAWARARAAACARGKGVWTEDLRKRFGWLLCIFSQSWGNLTISVRRSDSPTDGTGISGLMRCFHGPRRPQWRLAPILLMQLFSSKKGKNNEILNQTIHCIPVILQLGCLFIRDRSIFHFFNWISHTTKSPQPNNMPITMKTYLEYIWI